MNLHTLNFLRSYRYHPQENLCWIEWLIGQGLMDFDFFIYFETHVPPRSLALRLLHMFTTHASLVPHEQVRLQQANRAERILLKLLTRVRL